MSKLPPSHARKYLSAGSLIDGLQGRFERIADRRRAEASITRCPIA